MFKQVASRRLLTEPRFTGALVALMIAGLFCASAASGAANFGHVGQFGGSGAGDGQFRDNPAPQRIALHDASGKLFIADRGNDRIQVFVPTPSGAAFDFAIATPRPVGLAVDQADGSLYVSNDEVVDLPEGIRKFAPDDPADPGTYTLDPAFVSPTKGPGVGQFGQLMKGSVNKPAPGALAVAPGGDLLVADVGRQVVHRFTATGGYLSSFTGCADEPFPGFCMSVDRPAFTDIRDIAVNGDGGIIVAERRSDGGRIDRYNADGSFASNLSKQNLPVPNTQLTDFSGDSGIVLAASRQNSEVFVTSVTGDGVFSVQPIRIFQFEDDQLVGNFTVATGFTTSVGGYPHGLTVSTLNKRLYMLTGQGHPLYGIPSPYRVQAFRAVQTPILTIDPVSDISATGAKLSGSINPNGEQIAWRFRHRPVGASTWSSTPVPDGALDGDALVAVEVTVNGLEPNTDYEFLLAANAGTVGKESEPQTFTTLIAPPVVDTGIGSSLSDTGVTLTGGVNPRNTGTEYFFEWGETASYGNRVPLDADAQVGSGALRLPVRKELTDLEPGQTYHFRLVANNIADQVSEGEDRTFTTLSEPASGLQGDRGYELVTKQPMGFAVPTIIGGSADHGDALIYGSGPTDPHFAGEDEPHRFILAERDDSGWSHRAVDLPDPAQITFSNSLYASADMSRIFTATRNSYYSEDQNGRRDLHLNLPGQDPIWITKSQLVPEGEPHTDEALSGFLNGIASPDSGALSKGGKAIAFGSKRPLLPSDPNPPDYAMSGTTQIYTGAGVRLYKWKEGVLTYISVRPDGSTPAGPSVKLGGTILGPGNPQANSPHAVSGDGNRVFWSDGTDVYVHLDGEERSRLVGAGIFVDALADGSRAFYVSSGRIFSYDVDQQVTQDLTGDARVQGVVALAQSGEKIYYVARAALATDSSPLGLRPVAGSPNLYVTILDGQGSPTATRLVAVLGEGDGTGQGDGIAWNLQQMGRAANVSPDGRVLMFGSRTALTGQPTAGAVQAFVYDDRARSLVCVSCPADGSVPQPRSVNHDVTSGSQDVGAALGYSAIGWQNSMTAKRLVSTDGTVFFDTATPLLPRDENLERDVYEYRDGQLRMLTSGRPDDSPSVITSASDDGKTVFISTVASYDPRDIEPGMRKIWAFRVDGGFPYNGSTPGCAGQGCEGPVETVPEPPLLGSLVFRGNGNLEPDSLGRRSRLMVRRSRVTGSRARIKVIVPDRGRIVVNGPAVRRTSRAISGAGNYVVRVRLSKRASKVLNRRGSLRAIVKVQFRSRQVGSATKRLRLNFKWSSARKGGQR